MPKSTWLQLPPAYRSAEYLDTYIYIYIYMYIVHAIASQNFTLQEMAMSKCRTLWDEHEQAMHCS